MENLLKLWIYCFIFISTADARSFGKSIVPDGLAQATTSSISNSVNTGYGYLDGFGSSKLVEIERNDPSEITMARRFKKKTTFRPTHVKASILTMAVYGLLVRNLKVKEGATKEQWVLFGVAVFCYLLEAFLSSTRRYLTNMMTPKELFDRIETIKTSFPKITWNLQNYHYRDSFAGKKNIEESYQDCNIQSIARPSLQTMARQDRYNRTREGDPLQTEDAPPVLESDNGEAPSIL